MPRLPRRIPLPCRPSCGAAVGKAATQHRRWHLIRIQPVDIADRHVGVRQLLKPRVPSRWVSRAVEQLLLAQVLWVEVRQVRRRLPMVSLVGIERAAESQQLLRTLFHSIFFHGILPRFGRRLTRPIRKRLPAASRVTAKSSTPPVMSDCQFGEMAKRLRALPIRAISSTPRDEPITFPSPPAR